MPEIDWIRKPRIGTAFHVPLWVREHLGEEWTFALDLAERIWGKRGSWKSTSLYPALARLERERRIISRWEPDFYDAIPWGNRRRQYCKAQR